jgi:nucleoside-diphosphate-sugar epimerase
MIIFTGGGAIYETFAERYPCKKISIRQEGPEQLVRGLADRDIVVHNAANLSPADPGTAVEDNFILTKRLVDALLHSGGKTPLIFISSMSMLGKGGAYKSPAEMNPYAFSKYIAELYCFKSGLPVTSVRFSTLFYKNVARDGLSKMIADAVATGQIQLINGGKDTRDFIPLTVAMEYLYKVTGVVHNGAVYNIASGNSVSFAEAAAMVKQAMPQITISSIEKNLSAPFVLSEFGKDDIGKLGVLPLNLQDHIREYIGQLT